MANKNNPKNHQQDPEEVIESAINRTENYLYKNGKMLLTILGAVVLVIGGFLAYKYLYIPNRSEKAGAMMFVAEQQFSLEDWDFALNGDGNNPGFLQVIDQYGSTPEGNIANHYAGICYLNMGEKENALKYLEKYNTSKGVPNSIINAQNYGLQGDILTDLGNYTQAVERYRKAVDAGKNSFTAPVYLKKMAFALNEAGKPADAVDALQRIADEYPGSMEARDVEKYIGAFQEK